MSHRTCNGYRYTYIGWGKSIGTKRAGTSACEKGRKVRLTAEETMRSRGLGEINVSPPITGD